MEKIKINLYDLLLCLSNAGDLVSAELSNHHQQVAYLAFHLASHIKLPVSQRKEIFLAALLHDIGALSNDERISLIETESTNVNCHGFRGAKLLYNFKPLQNVANIIKYHHLPWNNGEGLVYEGENVQISSHIIHLADRICVNIDPTHHIITQVPKIISAIEKQRNLMFEPSLVDALKELSAKEYIWMDLIYNTSEAMKAHVYSLDILNLEIDDILELAYIFSHIIDFRSSFTARHSAGVAKTAEKLAQLIGFSPYECKMMLIAGYLHDLGKIAISNDILEKPAKLNEEEFNAMRTHTFYTYRILDAVEQFKIINVWASFHHEKLNGNGYPFHIKGDNIPLGSRIMAVADIFTAITENRPYREGMDDANTIKVLHNMVGNNSIDENVVRVLIDNLQEINTIREYAQHKAAEQYEKFLVI